MTWTFEIDDKPSAADVEGGEGRHKSTARRQVVPADGRSHADTHVRQRQGRSDGAALMAIVVEGARGRIYLAPTRTC